MLFETLIDQPFVKRNAVLRKGLGFLNEPVARGERLFLRQSAYDTRPPVFANSLPKSGTHLLLQATRVLPRTRYLGRFIATSPSLTQREKSPEQLARAVSRILPGETLGSHLYHAPEVAAQLARMNALHLFIYRDPRDVITSEAYYLAEMNRWHRMYKHFNKLSDDKSRLTLALDGLDHRYPECNARLLPYAGWLQDPNTLAIRYEDIAGPHQQRELTRIAEAYRSRGGSDVAAARLVEVMTRAIDPQKSHTFRRGGSGKWQKALSTAEAEAVTQRLRPALEAFDYPLAAPLPQS